MSSELDEVARALFNGQLPSIWRKLAPATLKSLGNWMEHFLKRLSQYNKWVSSRLTPLIINILILNYSVSYLLWTGSYEHLKEVGGGMSVNLTTFILCGEE